MLAPTTATEWLLEVALADSGRGQALVCACSVPIPAPRRDADLVYIGGCCPACHRSIVVHTARPVTPAMVVAALRMANNCLHV